ncbi:MAG: YegS/Rv2252/BmrU family lipid kinase [Eubacteriales bacterium]|nr:YegS/Rv2252/BmrU family lipid kinase [Eubacteriales bacterium]
MKKMLLIINPQAGRGAMRGKVIDCISAFQQAGYEVTVHVTEGAQDATRVAQRKALLFDRIVCAGGDGTLNETVTGLMQAPVRPPLGYIPAGTTNDFASSLGIPKTPAEAAVIAAGDRLQALDVGRFNERYFNYIAAFGVFTEVSYATPQQSKNIFGRAAYLFEGMKALTNIKRHRIRVQSVENTIEDEFIYGMVSNTVSVGGFKAITPDGVSLDDGLYEVLLVYPVENPMELQWLVNDLLTRNTDSTRFVYFRTARITFEAENEVPWTLDGEFGGAIRRAEIENRSRAITFVTGEREPDGAFAHDDA